MNSTLLQSCEASRYLRKLCVCNCHFPQSLCQKRHPITVYATVPSLCRKRHSVTVYAVVIILCQKHPITVYAIVITLHQKRSITVYATVTSLCQKCHSVTVCTIVTSLCQKRRSITKISFRYKHQTTVLIITRSVCDFVWSWRQVNTSSGLRSTVPT